MANDPNDIYATMVYKGDDEEEDEDESLPPLLKRLPKDFGGGDYVDDDEDESSISGTMIVKSDRRRSNYSGSSGARSGISGSSHKTNMPTQYSVEQKSPRGKTENSNDVEGEEDGMEFSTFVVRERDNDDYDDVRDAVEDDDDDDDEGMGTMVRRGVGTGGGTMKDAVESMQKVGDGIGGGYPKGGRSRGGGSGGEGQLRQQGSGKVSSSSLPDTMTREDPSTKYDLLHELGKSDLFFFSFIFGVWGAC